MEMRAKMVLESVTKTTYGEGLQFRAVCRSDAYPADGSDENNTYSKFSPSAELKLQVCNPDLFGKFAPGDQFYVDFTKVETK